MFKQLALGAALLAGSISLVSAGTIDFEDLTESQPGDSDQTLVSGGVTFTALRGLNGPGSLNDILAVFDTDCVGASCTGGDSDLSFPGPDGFGLVLIVNEQTPVGDDGPDDQLFGTIDVAFAAPVFVDDLVFLDLGDPNGGSLQLFNNSIPVGGAVGLAGNGDNTAATTLVGGVLADQIVITFATSGALAEVNFTQVPVPAALPLLFSGLLGGLFFSRRKEESATA